MTKGQVEALCFLKDFKQNLMVDTIDGITTKAADLLQARKRFEQARGQADPEIVGERLAECMRRIGDLCLVLQDSEKLAALAAIFGALESEEGHKH